MAATLAVCMTRWVSEVQGEARCGGNGIVGCAGEALSRYEVIVAAALAVCMMLWVRVRALNTFWGPAMTASASLPHRRTPFGL